MIAIIIAIVAIIAGIVGWLIAKKSQAPTLQTVATQPSIPVAQTQPTTPVTQPAPADETARWQTYSDTRNGFEVKYPNGYVTLLHNDKYLGDEPSFTIRKTGNNKEGAYVFGFSNIPHFLDGDKDKIQNPDAWLADQNRLGNKYTKTTFNGQIAYMPQYDTHGFTQYFWFVKNGSAYDEYDVFVSKNDNIGSEIVLTFKFLK